MTSPPVTTGRANDSSVRELALCAAVNPNTMQKALSALEQSGLVLSRRTLGRFVTEDPAVISEARTALATHQITELIQKMQQLGFQKAGNSHAD